MKISQNVFNTKETCVLGLLFICLFLIPQYSFSAGLKRVVLLETMPVPVVLKHSEWFILQLKELGYEDGKNLDLQVLKAEGDRGRAEKLLRESLVQKRPDIVVTNATLATQAALKVLKGTDIPILFMTVSDPVGAGIIDEIGKPTGKNITGKVHMIKRETRIKMAIGMVKGKFPERSVRIGFIHSSYPSAMGDIRELIKASQFDQRIIFLPYQLEYKRMPEGLAPMLENVRKGVEELHSKIDFWWEPSGPLGEVERYTETLMKHSDKSVLMGTKLAAVKMGALLHLTPSVEGSGREAAKIADAILKGADPGKIPVGPPASFDIGINIKTALNLGIVVPPDILKLAGDNVFK